MHKIFRWVKKQLKNKIEIKNNINIYLVKFN